MLVKKRVTSNYTSVETPYSIWEHRMPDEAIKHYREALKIRRELVELDPSFKPKLADALNNLANAYYTQGLLDQAIEHYNEALKIRREQVEIDKTYKPKLTDALNNLGVAYRNKGLLDRAIEHLKEALSIRRELVEIDEIFKPKLANTQNNLAITYYRKGNHDEAIEHYKEALKIRRELIRKEEHNKPQFLTSLILLGIATATRKTEEDKILSKEMQIEAKIMLQDPIITKSPQYPDLVSLAKIFESLIKEL